MTALASPDTQVVHLALLLREKGLDKTLAEITRLAGKAAKNSKDTSASVNEHGLAWARRDAEELITQLEARLYAWHARRQQQPVQYPLLVESARAQQGLPELTQ